MSRMWVADDCAFDDREWDYQHGSSYEEGEGKTSPPAVRRPIGFMRDKPRVRVKAWTQPILKRNDK